MSTPSPSHILAPISLKDNTDLTLDWARQITHQLKAKLTLFYASPEGASDTALMREELAAFARSLRSALGHEDVTPRLEADWDPSNAISQAASEGTYDLIMMLTHHRSFFQRLREGSETDEVITKSATPLLVVPDDLPAPRDYLGRRILVATALDDPGPLAWAKAWASALPESNITFLYVIDTPRAHLPEVSQSKDPAGLFKEIVEHARAEVNAYLHTHEDLTPTVPFEVEVRVGDSAQEISRDVREVGFDLVITGHHHRSVIGRVLHGSVAEEVVHKADVPVLIVPAASGA